jgi:hypothetical protein
MGVSREAVDVSLTVLGLQVEKLHLSVKSPFRFFEILVFDPFSLELASCQLVTRTGKCVCREATTSLVT